MLHALLLWSNNERYNGHKGLQIVEHHASLFSNEDLVSLFFKATEGSFPQEGVIIAEKETSQPQQWSSISEILSVICMSQKGSLL